MWKHVLMPFRVLDGETQSLVCGSCSYLLCRFIKEPSERAATPAAADEAVAGGVELLPEPAEGNPREHQSTAVTRLSQPQVNLLRRASY